MDLNRLYEILADTTIQLRKGEELEGTPELVEQATNGEPLTAGGVLTINAMPHESEARPDLDVVDCCLLSIGVDRGKAEGHRTELVDILRAYPSPDRLAAGPSYIEVGAEIGDQGAAFQLFALGKTLGLWDVITPGRMGMEGEEARELAGCGMVMMTGFTG